MADQQKASSMMERPQGKQVMGASAMAPNALEQKVLQELDVDRINDLAECLFVLNNRKFGPIAGAYMVVCTEPGKQWCVGQLNADRLKPIVLFEDQVYDSPELAQAAAHKIKQDRGESAPCRCT